MAVIHEDVLVDPSGPGRIRPDDGMNSFGQSTLDLLHVFQNTRARPVEVRSIFKHDEDVGISEHRLRSYGFYMRGGKQGRDNGISDLIFDDARRLTHPRSMDNDFDVGNIRQGIERNSPQRPN